MTILTASAAASSTGKGAVQLIRTADVKDSLSVVFTNIPQTFTTLMIVSQLQMVANSTYGYRLNNDASSLYTYTMLISRGSSGITSTRVTSSESLANASGYYNFVAQFPDYLNVTSYIMNYTGSGFKTILTQYGQANAVELGYTANLYRSTQAVTSLACIARDSQNFNVGSRISLYGIRG